MGDSPAMIQGFLQKRAMKSGKNWKKRYFVLRSNGELSYSEKKGTAVKRTIQITRQTNIAALKELEGEGGISVTGPGHQPLYLQADSEEVAEGWIQAMNIIKSGGSGNLKKEDERKGDNLRDAFANKSALGSSGRALGSGAGRTLGRGGAVSTLERRKKNTLARKKERQRSMGEEAVPPPPPPSASMADPDGGFDEDADESDDDVRDADDEVPDADPAPAEDVDGYTMRLGSKDVFVDAQGWEYYKSRKDFTDGKKPLGRAVLSLLV